MARRNRSCTCRADGLGYPFTYSIANGLAFGFISYVVLKAFTGKARDVHLATWLVAALFVIRFAFFAE